LLIEFVRRHFWFVHQVSISFTLSLRIYQHVQEFSSICWTTNS
jgi:hypothetical protein